MSRYATNNPVLTSTLRALLRRPPAALALLAPGLALAGPTGEDVVRGSAEVVRPNSTSTVINQFTQRAAINWQTFNVDADEYVLFNQPDASSVVLNRVLGGDASYILGQIDANGQVFLLNPQGVYFTHGASLDVQGFLGSTLDMDPDAFMAGDYTLTRSDASPASAQVINHGTITAGTGGYVMLAGDYTENTSIISANAGTVALISGNALTLDIAGDGLVNFAVDEATLSEAAGVRNAGSLIADGGRVIMTAKVANDLVATAVNNEGLVRARSIEEHDGEIYLVGFGGDVANTGTLDADGENADGGFVGIYSDRDVTLADGAVQTAAGDANHEGGTIRAIAEEHLDYQRDNLIRVTGGISGGFVEVSGHGSIAVRGTPEIGAGGTYYIDPASIHIASFTGSGSTYVGVDEIVTQLNGGTNVVLAATNTITTSATSLVATGSGNLTIGIGSMSSGTGVGAGCGFYGFHCFGPAPDFTAVGNGNIDLTGLNIDIGGDLNIQAGVSSGTINIGNIDAGGLVSLIAGNATDGGAVTVGQINTPGNVNILSQNINIAGIGQTTTVGNVDIVGTGSDGNVIITGGIEANGYVSIAVSGHSDPAPSISIGGDINAGGSISLGANATTVVDGALITVQGLNAGGAITVTATGGTGSGANISFGGDVVATSNIMINADGGSGVNGGDVTATGNIVSTSGTVNITASGGSTGGGNINVTGNVQGAGLVSFQAYAGADAANDGNITVSGNISGANISLTADASTGAGGGNINIGSASGGAFGAIATGGSGSGGNINITAGSLDMTGNVSLTANAAAGNFGGNITTGNINGANIAITANGGANSGGRIVIADVNATGNLNVHAFGVAGSTAAGNISAAALIADGSVDITTQLAGGGDIYVNSDIRGADVEITVGGGRLEVGSGVAEVSFGGGDIKATAGSVDIVITQQSGGDGVLVADNLIATGNVNVTVMAGQGHLHLGDYVGGVLTAPGSIDAGGNVNVSLSGSVARFDAGNINAGGGVGIDVFGANAGEGDIRLGNIDAAGAVTIDATHGDNHVFGDISARHINAHFTPYALGNVNVTMGLLHVNGTTTGNRDIVVSLDSFSGNLNGTLDIAGAQAENGGISLHANAASGSASINVTGAMSARRFIDIQARNNVATGDLTVNNPTGLADVFVMAGVGAPGDIVVNGNITVSGRATSNDPNAASVHLDATGFNTNDITVTGGISVTAAARAYTGANGPITGSDTGTFTSDGNQGIAGIKVATQDGTVDLGNVNVTAVGQAFVEVHALNVDVGNVTMNVADGSFERVSTLSNCDGMTCAISRTEAMASGAMADVRFFYTGFTPSGSATFGNIDIDAGGGRVDLRGYLDVSGGGIAIDARGNAFTVESNGTLSADTIDFAESANGGGAGVSIETAAAGGSVTLSNAVNLTAPGNASLRIIGDNVSLDDVNLTATAGTFERSGSPAYDDHDGPFSGNGGGGPHVDEGTVTGGGARLHLSGYSSMPSSHAAADSISVNGAISIDGAGNAELEMRAADVTVSGNIAVRSGYMQQEGTYASIDTDTGASYAGSVVSNWGRAMADITASGNVQIADLLIDGPTAGGQLEGNNVHAGAISITARGGDLAVTETETLSGVTTTLQVDAPNTLTGFGIHAENALQLTDAFTLNAVGVGGVVMSGATIDTRDITINVTNADYTVKTPQLFSGNETTFTAGGVILGIAGAVAQVNGDLTLNAGQQVHFGGAANVSGDFNATAGSGITRTIPDTVNFLNGLEGDDDDATIVLPAGFNVQAANINLLSDAGPVKLDGAVLNASGAVAIAGGNVSLSGVNIAGETVQITATGNVSNSAPPGAITAGALAISAGGNINLANTVLTVGAGSIAGVNGDADFLRLLATQNVAIPAAGPSLAIRGNNVVLGNLSVAGDYLYLQADTLTLSGTVTTDSPDLLQLAPVTADAAFTFNQSTAGGGVAYVYDTLAAFDASTIALGTTGHSGNVAVGGNGMVDIGDTNLFVLTTGRVLGLERVTSSGVVKDLATLIGGEFDIPQTDEIDTRQDIVQSLRDEYGLDHDRDDEDEGDEEGEDTDTDTTVESEEDSLIRQDTVDEELMCR